MATALDLLMSTKEDVNLLSEESDICTIDAKTRVIFVPSTIVVGGVQSDKNAERIKFSCPKIVGDNLDLSKFSVRINFENVSSVDFNVSIKDQYICDDVAVDGENVTFSWLIGRNAARYMGTVRFIVCAVKTDSDSNISVEWNTTIAEVPVLEGIEIDQPQIGKEEKDVVNQLLELTKNTSSEAVQNVNSAKEQAIKDIQSVSQPDTTLTIEGGLAEAKATGEAIGSLKEDLNNNIASYYEYELVKKAFTNGTGFVDSESEVSFGEAKISSIPLSVQVKSDKYIFDMYYLSSATNKYPHYEGRVTKQGIWKVPANQYFVFFIRKPTFDTLTDEEFSEIISATEIKNYNAIWERIYSLQNDNLELSNEIKNIISVPNVTIEIDEIISYATKNQIQGLTKIKDKFLQFTSYTPGSESKGKIFVIGEDGNLITNFHDFGHTPTVNYIAKNDTLIVGNGSTNVDESPLIQFMGNVSTKTNMYKDDEDYFEIDVSALYDGGYGLSVCTGEDYRIVYCLMPISNKIYKLVLGVGESNFADQFGTYVYRGESNFNGTAKKVNEYSFDFSTLGTIQGLIYWHGVFWVLSGVTDITVYKIKIKENVLCIVSSYMIPSIGNSGEHINSEPEGMCISEGAMYISDYYGTGFRLVKTGIN